MKFRVSIFLFYSFLVLGVGAERFPLSGDDSPNDLDDLREIQAALQANLEQARAATVCLQMKVGSGSAVIVSEDGLVLTAAHVTGGVGEEIQVVMEDGRELKGVSLGLNSETDSAMLQIVGEGPFPYVEVDLDDRTELGDWVFSLGHSGGFDKERGVNVRVGRMVSIGESTIQSDCMLIGGDSGGPLFNMEGKLIGIHSRVGMSREESWHVPVKEFRGHWDELYKGDFIGEGVFAKKAASGSGFLGVRVKNSEEGGLEVLEIFSKGAAEEAGLRVGDQIMEINGKRATEKGLDVLLASLAAGDQMTLKWETGGEIREEVVKLGERP